MLQILKSKKGGFSPRLQEKSFDVTSSVVNSEDNAQIAAQELSKIVESAMRLLTLEFFKQLHGVLGSNTWYALKDRTLSS